MEKAKGRRADEFCGFGESKRERGLQAVNSGFEPLLFRHRVRQIAMLRSECWRLSLPAFAVRTRWRGWSVPHGARVCEFVGFYAADGFQSRPLPFCSVPKTVPKNYEVALGRALR